MQDVAEESRFTLGFETREIRRRFIIKVYSLLLIQLFISSTIMLICIFVPVIRDFLREDWILMIVSFIVAFILFIALSCCRCARTHVPLNYILLTIMTLFFGLALGGLSAIQKTYIAVAAMGTTAAVVIFLSLLATCPCIDITGWGIYLAVAGLALMLIGMITMILAFVMNIRVMFMIYAGLGTLLFSLYIVFDTQMILGGRKYQISPEDYIFAVVTLFVDIVNLFMMLLALMSGTSN